MATTKVVMENVTMTNDGEEYYELIKQPTYMVVIYSLVYGLVFLSALVGNTLVIGVVMKNKSMHNATNYFIINLAVADILVALFCVPITLLSNLYTGWRFGAFMCKVTPYLQGVAVSASVNTLVAIAIDRYDYMYHEIYFPTVFASLFLFLCLSLILYPYLAICKTLEFKLRPKTCRLIIVCIWVWSLSIILPWAVFYKMTEFKTKTQIIPMCEQNWPSVKSKKAYVVGALFLGCYALPLVVICVCYILIVVKVWNRGPPGDVNSSSHLIHKSRVKVVKMIAVVVIIFASFWMPLYVVNLLYTFGFTANNTLIPKVVIPVSQWLGSANSGINPIIYCFFSRKFREGFKDAITCFRLKSRGTTQGVFTYSRSCLTNKYTSAQNNTNFFKMPPPSGLVTNGSTSNSFL